MEAAEEAQGAQGAPLPGEEAKEAALRRRRRATQKSPPTLFLLCRLPFVLENHGGVQGEGRGHGASSANINGSPRMPIQTGFLIEAPHALGGQVRRCSRGLFGAEDRAAAAIAKFAFRGE